MTIKYSYEEESDIPSEAKSLYTESDGKFILNVEGVVPKNEYTRLNLDLMNEKKTHKETISDLAALRMKADQEDTSSPASASAPSSESYLQLQLQKAAEEREYLNKKIAEFETKDVKRKIRDHVRIEAQKAGVTSSAISDVELNADMIFEMGDNGQIFARQEASSYAQPGSTPSDWLSEQKNIKPHWWPSSSGGGSIGSSDSASFAGSNPYSSDVNNLTEQSLLEKQEPEKAARLARLAGYDFDTSRPSMKYLD